MNSKNLKNFRINNGKNFAIVFFIFALMFIPYWFVNSKIIELNGGCGNDGLTYCSMALGNLEFAPFSRRTFLPGFIHLFQIQNVFLAFQILNAVFIIICFIILIKLMNLINSTNTYLVITLFILNPHILRWFFSYPVIMDYLGLLLILLCVYFEIGIKNNLKYIFLSSSFIILCFVRENASITIAFSLLAWAIYRKSEIINYLILFLISIIFTLISFNQPSTINTVQETNILKISIEQIKYFTSSLENITLLFYFVIFGFSIFSLISIFMFPKRTERFGAFYIASLIMFITGPLIGGEARHFVIPGVLMQIWFFSKTRKMNEIIILLMIQLSFWVLGAYSDGSVESFMILFGQRFTDFSNTKNLIIQSIFQFLLFLTVYLIINFKFKSRQNS